MRASARLNETRPLPGPQLPGPPPGPPPPGPPPEPPLELQQSGLQSSGSAELALPEPEGFAPVVCQYRGMPGGNGEGGVIGQLQPEPPDGLGVCGARGVLGRELIVFLGC